MIDARSLQTALAAKGFYKGAIDGDFGPASVRARDALLSTSLKLPITAWSSPRRQTALEQWVMREAGCEVGTIDGLPGTQTKFALEQWQNRLRGIDPAPAQIIHQPPIWPRQADLEAFYGKPGSDLIMLELPWTMRLAWDKKQEVTRIRIHSKCADSAFRALAAAEKAMGIDAIRKLGLDLFGGCYADRPMRGGTRLSTHAWAIALDINPEANQLRWGADRAAMTDPDCRPFLDAFATEGWISLGRERNFDWMHLQAARL